jgi:hypothetical protein
MLFIYDFNFFDSFSFKPETSPILIGVLYSIELRGRCYLFMTSIFLTPSVSNLKPPRFLSGCSIQLSYGPTLSIHFITSNYFDSFSFKLEPPRFLSGCSIQLRYGPILSIHFITSNYFDSFSFKPETSPILIGVLYSIELRRH